uniref:Uncharacterized protein n=1 Tax=Oryza nivara TaxID=4536 RepID=A0A0E0GPH0_ORYNI
MSPSPIAVGSQWLNVGLVGPTKGFGRATIGCQIGAHISLLSFFFVTHARSGGTARGRRDGPSRPARRCPAEKAEAASSCLGQGHLVEGGSVASDYSSVASADFEGFTDLGTSLLARPAVVFDNITAAAASVAVTEAAKPRAVGPTARSVFAMDCVPLWGWSPFAAAARR